MTTDTKPGEKPLDDVKYTPGPWDADEIAPEDPEWGACEIWAPRKDDTPELISSHVCGMANARLIAAAPDLLEALLECRRKFETLSTAAEGRELSDEDDLLAALQHCEIIAMMALDKIDAALSKATGGKP